VPLLLLEVVLFFFFGDFGEFVAGGGPNNLWRRILSIILVKVEIVHG